MLSGRNVKRIQSTGERGREANETPVDALSVRWEMGKSDNSELSRGTETVHGKNARSWTVQ